MDDGSKMHRDTQTPAAHSTHLKMEAVFMSEHRKHHFKNHSSSSDSN